VSIVNFAELDQRDEALADGEWFPLEGASWNQYKVKVRYDKRWDHEFKAGIRGHKGKLSKKDLERLIGKGMLMLLDEDYLVAGWRRAIVKTDSVVAFAPVGDRPIDENPPDDELATPAEMKKLTEYDHWIKEVASRRADLVDPENEVDEEAEKN